MELPEEKLLELLPEEKLLELLPEEKPLELLPEEKLREPEEKLLPPLASTWLEREITKKIHKNNLLKVVHTCITGAPVKCSTLEADSIV